VKAMPAILQVAPPAPRGSPTIPTWPRPSLVADYPRWMGSVATAMRWRSHAEADLLRLGAGVSSLMVD
jgi:hypothetical protein